MNSMMKKALLTAVIGAMSLGAASDVSARSFGAAAGRATTASDNACFNSLSGIVANGCGSARTFEVQLPADSSGGKTVSFTARSGVSCTAMATNAVNNAFVFSNTVLINNAALTTQALSNIPLPAGGKLWLQCSINPGGSLATVNYNQ
jgi:hypothetical protein